RDYRSMSWKALVDEIRAEEAERKDAGKPPLLKAFHEEQDRGAPAAFFFRKSTYDEIRKPAMPSAESRSWGQKIMGMIKSLRGDQTEGAEVMTKADVAAAHTARVAKHAELGQRLLDAARTGAAPALEIARAEAVWNRNGRALDAIGIALRVQ